MFYVLHVSYDGLGAAPARTLFEATLNIMQLKLLFNYEHLKYISACTLDRIFIN